MTRSFALMSDILPRENGLHLSHLDPVLRNRQMNGQSVQVRVKNRLTLVAVLEEGRLLEGVCKKPPHGVLCHLKLRRPLGWSVHVAGEMLLRHQQHVPDTGRKLVCYHLIVETFPQNFPPIPQMTKRTFLNHENQTSCSRTITVRV